jgi:hypothetical protein
LVPIKELKAGQSEGNKRNAKDETKVPAFPKREERIELRGGEISRKYS